MSDIVEQVLVRLRELASAERWAEILAPDVEFEALRTNLSGRAEVAKQLAGGNFADLDWGRTERPNVVMGMPIEGRRERALAITLQTRDGLLTRVSQQGVVVGVERPSQPMAMDAALRARFDGALAGDHPMTLCYVDPQGRPHVSLRGSIITFGPDRLALWARAGSGLTEAVKSNPNVALLFRDPKARATYQIAGRAYVAEDEATRKAIYDATPEIERRHDFALLGAGIVIELDVIEGHAGFTPAGQLEPIRLVRTSSQV